MSEKKRVIHVKDLVIKADNVVIEPQRNDRRDHDRDDRIDPFFGGPRRRRDEEESSSKHREDESSDRRGGFRWF
ncbi:hypothetical protein SAMN04487936_103242 [Halobacillus dabanensis]|uniref:Uncharacterized protein n=1 Tax=Halobacillus dabanensis TaxID=240302 RepID=A0A1I3T7C7_HALDA|nr:hypothetical protein [Halobacillus dabanensis]SFJ66392.1 hypothetical protein SAMN04487936_103242 [Halobacillus dabanensis]